MAEVYLAQLGAQFEVLMVKEDAEEQLNLSMMLFLKEDQILGVEEIIVEAVALVHAVEVVAVINS
jgi:hypothetical protein